MSRLSLLVALVATTAAPAFALPADFKAKADAIIAKAAPANGPGLAVVVAENGVIKYRAGRGLANVGTEAPITSTTPFRFASITKQFTAAAILKLVEQGKVGLDDPLSKYLPDYPAPGASATVRQLLNHTSGIMPYTAIPGFMATAAQPRSTGELVAYFKDAAPRFQPGERYEYNNSGYVLLGAILEKVTGKGWDAAVVSLVTGPLGLRSIRGGIGEASVPGMALGYGTIDGKPSLAAPIHMSVPGAAGALIGNAEDLARWGYALHHGKVVSAPLYALMTGTTTTADKRTEPYGFGLGTSDIRGRKSFEHGGNINGFATQGTYLPDSGIYVAVLSNSEDSIDVPSTMRRLAAAALADPYTEFTAQPLDLAAVRPLLGSYRITEGQSRVFFEAGGKLYTRRNGGPREVVPAGNNRFFYAEDTLTWFEIADEGGAKVMKMHQGGAVKPELASYAGPVPAEAPGVAVADAILSSYVGSYRSVVGTFVVARDANGITVKLDQQPAFPVKAVSPTEFTLEMVGARIRFGEVVNAKAKTLTLLQGGQEVVATRID